MKAPVRFWSSTRFPAFPSWTPRALVRHLRTRGVMRGVLSGDWNRRRKNWWRSARQIPSMSGLDLASRVSTPNNYEWTKTVEPCSPSEVIGATGVPLITWSPTTTASNTTFCGAWCTRDVASPWFRRSPRGRCAGAEAGRQCSSRTGPGDPEPLERAGRQHTQADRQDADLRHLPGHINCSAWRWAARRTS